MWSKKPRRLLERNGCRFAKKDKLASDAERTDCMSMSVNLEAGTTVINKTAVKTTLKDVTELQFVKQWA